jgi:hypothetical protein
MSRTDIPEALDRMLKDGFGTGKPITIPEGTRTKIIGALITADRIWSVLDNGDGFTLQWYIRGLPAHQGEDLTPEVIRKLADAIESLNTAGIPVTFGMSNRGVTYLNIRVADADDVADWEDVSWEE